MGVPWRATRPTCKHSHPFPEHLRRLPNGWAYCRECDRLKYVPATPDESAVVRAVTGDPPARLTPRERAIVVRSLTDRGLSARLIAEHVRCTPRTVHRIRNRAAAA
ncbi:hypothetical protein J7E97_07905 [Streptomyces sp. ISL-66]|uniref:hypothetical protein n=1 Tax=Streptomyces sp. ISL-66 TaxID=2819186 RepID=UPI001BEB5507|nr:hypothetical protein [Streptomyces sp. ISL-66]MBT2467797.1 hypothetical protein [Streptomyces sp. ISL-66]